MLAADSASFSNATSAATPARVALALAAVIAPASRSDPRIETAARGSTAARASPTTVFHVAASSSGHCSNAYVRGCNPSLARPGAILRAMSAASIGIVPDPHIGSTSACVPSQPAHSSVAAASVSRNGAFATACR